MLQMQQRTAIFNSDPGVLTEAQLLNLENHPCYLGSTNTNPATSENIAGIAGGLPGNLSTVWVIPYTRFPDALGGTAAIVDDGTECYDLGETIQINYLPPECGACETPNCPIAGPYTSLTDALDGANHCSEMVEGTPLVSGSVTYVSYYEVTTNTNSTSLGIVISNGSTGTGTCTVTRSAELFDVCTSAGISPSSFGGTFFNPVWTGLEPNTTYIIRVETEVDADCVIDDQCASYYSENESGCTTCENATCPVTSIQVSTLAEGRSGITTALAAAGL